jgi:hypothetical protein
VNEDKQGDERKINKRMNDDKKETGTWKEIKRVGGKNE